MTPTQQPPQPTPATVSDDDVRDVAYSHRQYRDIMGELQAHCASCGITWPCPTIRLTRTYHALREAAERAVMARERYRYLGSRPMPEVSLASGDGMAALAEFLSVENGFVAEMDALRDLLGIDKAAATEGTQP